MDSDVNRVAQGGGGGQGELQSVHDGGIAVTDTVRNAERGGQIGQFLIMGVLHLNGHADGHTGHEGGRRRSSGDGGDCFVYGHFNIFSIRIFMVAITGDIVEYEICTGIGHSQQTFEIIILLRKGREHSGGFHYSVHHRSVLG